MARARSEIRNFPLAFIRRADAFRRKIGTAGLFYFSHTLHRILLFNMPFPNTFQAAYRRFRRQRL